MKDTRMNLLTTPTSSRLLRLLLAVLFALTVVLVVAPSTALADDDCAGDVDDDAPECDDGNDDCEIGGEDDDAEYPVGRGTVEIGATVVTPTSTITIQGDDWDCETDVEIVTDDDDDSSTGERVLTTVRTDRQGRFSTTVTIPADVTTETLTIAVRGSDPQGEPRSDEVEVQVEPASEQVLAADTAQTGGAAAESDDGSVPVVPIAIAVGLVALAAVVIVRERRSL